LKALAKKLLVTSGALRLAARVRPNVAVILSYHSVRDDPSQDEVWIGPGITHSSRIFSRQMELLAQRFHPATLEDILLFLRGEKALPPRAVAVTFDDGYADNLHFAAPILSRFGIAAAFYLTVGVIGTADAPWFSRMRRAFLTSPRRDWQSSRHGRCWDISTAGGRNTALLAAFDLGAPLTGEDQRRLISIIEQELGVEPALPDHRLMLTWEEAKHLLDAGHLVGSHTLTHPNIAQVGNQEILKNEIAESKQQMEEMLKFKVRHFSYPHPALNPQWNQITLAATRDAGYETAVTTTRAPVGTGSDPLLLSRINAPRPEHEFLWNLERAFLQSPALALASASVVSEGCS